MTPRNYLRNIGLMAKLLTRDEFRNATFNRDKHICVNCGNAGQDAHHILERRLFDDGGYYLDNGATLCGPCHIKAEETVLSPEHLRTVCGIATVVLPSHLYRDQVYDKWGNIILPNGQRLKGELFHDESVQKILAGSLHLFTDLVKYPRTYHLPFSDCLTKDDRVLESTAHFKDKEVVVTAKMDGEQTTMYADYIHARSTEMKRHPSRTWVQNLHSKIKSDIPKGWRICGENLYAKHSIHYKHLYEQYNTYFLVFSIWNEKNICLSWSETEFYSELIGLKTVPVLYYGIYNEELIKGLFHPEYANDEAEGYVVRLSDSFSYRAFRNSVGKYVRKNHVQTGQHWFYGQKMVRNS